MKILMLAYEFPPYINGGLGNYCKKIAAYLGEKGNDIYVFGYNPGHLPIFETVDNLRIFRPRFNLIKQKSCSKRVFKSDFKKQIHQVGSIGSYNLLSFIKIVQLCKKHKPDIIAVHDWLSGIVGILAILFLRIPVVFHVHNTFFSMKTQKNKNVFGLIVKKIETILSKLSKKIIVPTNKMKNILRENGWEANKISIVNHGTDTELIKKSKNKEIQNRLEILKTMNNLTDHTRLLYIGRLVPEKGILNLLDAVSIVSRTQSNILLIVLGKADSIHFQKEIQNKIRSLCIQKHVEIDYQFHDQEDIISHYICSDICIFPSYYEPFGLVALEAMELGKPVILGNGFCENTFNTQNNESSLFVNSHDSVDIAKGILRLIKEPYLREKLCKNASKYIIPRFSWNRTVDETLLLYNKVMERTYEI